MNRREAAALVLVAVVVLGGRVLRRELLVGSDGAWREPGWLAEHLPSAVEAERGGTAARSPETPPPVLDPNTSPEDSLVHLPGVGPVLAARIATARDRGMQFARPEDLQNIKGIGPRLVDRLTPYLRFPAQLPPESLSGQSARSPDAPAP